MHDFGSSDPPPSSLWDHTSMALLRPQRSASTFATYVFQPGSRFVAEEGSVRHKSVRATRISAREVEIGSRTVQRLRAATSSHKQGSRTGDDAATLVGGLYDALIAGIWMGGDRSSSCNQSVNRRSSGIWMGGGHPGFSHGGGGGDGGGESTVAASGSSLSVMQTHLAASRTVAMERRSRWVASGMEPPDELQAEASAHGDTAADGAAPLSTDAPPSRWQAARLASTGSRRRVDISARLVGGRGGNKDARAPSAGSRALRSNRDARREKSGAASRRQMTVKGLHRSHAAGWFGGLGGGLGGGGGRIGGDVSSLRLDSARALEILHEQPAVASLGIVDKHVRESRREPAAAAQGLWQQPNRRRQGVRLADLPTVHE